MPEHDPVVLAYSHLRDFPRAADALHLLRRVASLVKPLMRARRWKVRELSEFYPDQANLLGLNINKGQKILLRLRYPNDTSLFLPLEQVADTLLHELAHIVHGPHDAVFHALWNQLRDEHMALTLKGFTGEGFLSEGHRLGGGNSNNGANNWGATGYTVGSSSSSPTPNQLQRPIPMDEARRLARAAAERRQAKAAAAEKEKERQARRFSTGHRLGGSTTNPTDMRSTVADAVARRNSHTPETMRGCATDGPQYSDQTRKWLADQAARNGFRTQAEEDAANDAAIAQALWELVQEDEKQRLGDRYVPPTAERPEGSGGWLSPPATSRTSQRGSSSASPIIIDVDAMDVDPPRGPPPQHRRPAPPPPTQAQARPTSMPPPPKAVTRRPAPPPPAPKPAMLSSGSRPRSSSSSAAPPTLSSSSSSSSNRGWTCSICTLHNPSTYLVCDACGVEKASSSSPPKEVARDSRPPSSSYRHSQPPPPLAHRPAPPPPASAPPRRSQAAANAAAAASSRASAMRHSGQSHKKPRVKKQVRFTPSTRGGSVSSMTSTSSRARPRSPPPATFGSGADSVVSSASGASGASGSSITSSTIAKVLAKHRPAPPPPTMPPRPQSQSQSRPPSSSFSSSSQASSSAAPASSTWMCTMCWTNMSRKHTTCGSCGKPREAWQQQA